jgi:hypothetical protein
MSDTRTLKITGMDCVVLLYHLHRYVEKYESCDDADRTLEQLTRLLSFATTVPRSVVESAMHSCNLLDEEKEFKHPDGASFDQFARKVGHGRPFNKKYNWFEDRK